MSNVTSIDTAHSDVQNNVSFLTNYPSSTNLFMAGKECFLNKDMGM